MSEASNPTSAQGRVKLKDLLESKSGKEAEENLELSAQVPSLATVNLTIPAFSERDIQKALEPLVAAKILKPLAGKSLVVPPEYKGLPNVQSGKQVSNVLNFGTFRPFRPAWTALWDAAVRGKPVVGMDRKLVKPAQVAEWLRKMQTEIESYFVGGGTPTGLYNRLVTGLGRFKKDGVIILPPNGPAKHVPTAKQELVTVCDHLPIKQSALWDLRRPFGEIMGDLEITKGSNPGYPAANGATKDKWTLAATKVAMRILNGLNSGDPAKYVEEHEELFYVMIKNKVEMMPVDDWLTKVRPYYVFPYAVQLLMSSFLQPLSSAMESFYENPKSASALHHSWIGGGEQVVKWIKRDIPDEYTSDFIVYADDHLVKLRTKELVIVAPFDVSSMDMSCSATFEPVLVVAVKRLFGKERLGPFYQVVRLWARMLFHSNVLMGKGLVYHKQSGAGSGIPGISIAETIILLHALVRIREVFYEKPPQTSDPKVLITWWEQQMGLQGFQMKPIGDEVQTFSIVDGRVQIDSYPLWKPMPFSFLGQRLMKVVVNKVTGWVPVPVKIGKTVASFVRPRFLVTVGSSEPKLMGRCLGLLVAGGWSDPILYRGLSSMWYKYKNSGIKPSMDSILEIEGFEFVYPVGTVPEFPTRSRTIQFLLGILPLFDIKPSVPATVPPRESKEVREQKADALVKAKGSWADIADLMDEDEDVKVKSPQKVSRTVAVEQPIKVSEAAVTVPTSHAGTVVPGKDGPVVAPILTLGMLPASKEVLSAPLEIKPPMKGTPGRLAPDPNKVEKQLTRRRIARASNEKRGIEVSQTREEKAQQSLEEALDELDAQAESDEKAQTEVERQQQAQDEEIDEFDPDLNDEPSHAAPLGEEPEDEQLGSSEDTGYVSPD